MNWPLPLIGGTLIGLSASIMLLTYGRITGISGIINNILSSPTPANLWRYLFLLGMLLGAVLMNSILPENIYFSEKPLTSYLIAGVLVGFGTSLGSGCTSGHGVCGMSRLSRRSIISTCIFITIGMLTVVVMRFL